MPRDRSRPCPSLPRLRRRLAVVLVVYAVAGTVSQKMVPGVDEIFPFFGWSLFSTIPNSAEQYVLLIHRHDARRFEPPVSFHQAPGSVVRGNRWIGRKLIQRLGRAHEEKDPDEIRRLGRLLERNYLRGRVRYELRFERFDPLEKWRRGVAQESRSVAMVESGGGDGGSG